MSTSETSRADWRVAGGAILVAAAATSGCDDGDPPTGVEPDPDPLGVAEVEVRPSAVVLDDLGSTVTLEAVARDTVGRELGLAPEDFTWRSRSDAVVEVDESGRARAVGTGQVPVGVGIEGVSAHALIQVNQSEPRPVSGWEQHTASVAGQLRDVWGSAPDDVWAVGFGGTILHYDGVSWSRVENPAENERLQSVWGSGSDDVWTVGSSGVVLHWDGTEWKEVSAPAELEIRSIWGSGPEDIWALEGLGRFLRYDGDRWNRAAEFREQSPDAMWGSARDDVWAVGGQRVGPIDVESTVLHYDGSAWTEVENPGEGFLFDVWGSGPDDIWAVGDVILHFDGSEWEEVESPVTHRLVGVWGSGPNDVWAVGTGNTTIHFDGTTWREVPNPTPENLAAVWEMTPGDLWAVGLNGEILRGIR